LDLKKILIFRTGHLGDTIVAVPALWAIRKAFHEAELTLLSNSDAQNPNYISARAVLPENGLIDRWEAYPTNIGKLAAPTAWLKLLARLRNYRYEAVLYLMTRNRTSEQVERDLWFFRAAGIKRVLCADYVRHNSLGTKVANPTPRVEKEAEFLLDALASEGVAVDLGNYSTDLLLSKSETSSADGWIAANCGGSGRLVAVAPGSKWESKIWPEERFADVVAQLIGSIGIFPVILGGAEDREKGDRLLSAWRTGANAAGQLSVRESAALLRRCELYLGNDTGTMHLAAAVGTPCVAVFAAIDWVGRWEPFGEGHKIFRRSVECEGCHSPTCFNAGKCLALIAPDQVLAACMEILAPVAATENPRQSVG